MFKSATLLIYIIVWSVSCNIMRISHMKKSAVALFTWWPYLPTSKPHSRPRTGDRRDSGLCAPLEGLGHYRDGVDRKSETRWKLSDEKWKTYSCEEVVQNAEHGKLQGEQMEWKNAARHVVKEISKSPKLEKLKPADPVVLRIEERFRFGLWGATPRRRRRTPSFWTLRRRWKSPGFRIPWQSRRSPGFSTLLLWQGVFLALQGLPDGEPLV